MKDQLHLLMAQIHDVSCFRPAREDVVGVKVGTAPGKREKAKHRHRQHLVRLHARRICHGELPRGSERTRCGRSAMLLPHERRMSQTNLRRRHFGKDEVSEPQSWATPGNAFAAGSAKTIQQSHNKHYGRVYALAEPEAGALRRSRRSEPGG